MQKSLNISQAKLTEIAWSRGLLTYKLYKHQQKLYQHIQDAINNPDCVKDTINCSRRFGKSTVLCLVAIEYAIKNPNSQIRFATGTAKALKKITRPIFKQLLADCPQHLKPKFHTQDNIWTFPNGAEIHLSGTDGGNSDNLRGTASNLNIIDEAGFVDDLDYVLKSILMPQTITTGGTTILASTPPETPAHDFYNIAVECRDEGHYIEFTVYDNTNLTQKIIDLYAKESGGYNSTTFRREYNCEFITSEELQLIPEFDDSLVQAFNRDELYTYYHKYVSMDLGVTDFTAVLFGYYDFKKATLYIEDEMTMSGNEMTTDKLKDAIIEKETELFGEFKPHKRISDNNNLLLIQDLGSMHGLHFIPTDKETLEAMLNEVRMMVKDRRIVIHPRCTYLISNLKYGVWDKNRKKFARSNKYKHYDHLASLVYLVRNLDQHTNPIPSMYGFNVHKQFMNPYHEENNSHHALESLFGRKF